MLSSPIACAITLLKLFQLGKNVLRIAEFAESGNVRADAVQELTTLLKFTQINEFLDLRKREGEREKQRM